MTDITDEQLREIERVAAIQAGEFPAIGMPIMWLRCFANQVAELVQRAEREACAKLIDDQDLRGDRHVRGWLDLIAAAIRSRTTRSE